MAMAREMVERLQPRLCCQGTISTPGVARMPAAASRHRNTTPITTQL